MRDGTDFAKGEHDILPVAGAGPHHARMSLMLPSKSDWNMWRGGCTR